MATESEHRKQAIHNQAFLDAIDARAFPDWFVTAAFYKAVHLVEVLFRRKGHPSGNHNRRNQQLKRHYQSVWRDYRPLYDLSRKARYWCVAITPPQVQKAKTRLARLERTIGKLP
jgi:hypothetical protein